MAAQPFGMVKILKVKKGRCNHERRNWRRSCGGSATSFDLCPNDSESGAAAISCGDIGIVDLGLIYDIEIDNDAAAQIKMTRTTPACPYGEMLVGMAHRAAEKVAGVTKVEVVLVWDPVWDPKEMCSDLAKDQLGIW